MSQLVLLAGERMDVKRCVGRGEDTDGSQMEGDLRNGGAWIHTGEADMVLLGVF